jgi:hypothetical protein
LISPLSADDLELGLVSDECHSGSVVELEELRLLSELPSVREVEEEEEAEDLETFFRLLISACTICAWAID